ncbi:polyprenyl synthetase family protein [Gracilinema caldarium]|uniref:polyprenyl synthetase family protein n=1 Tax=Gracilinema caldarium TaxID=215591 RepID=UPI0026ED0C6E|nr:polyprenyl synthetase family protein [Gracilinema caldarium]
MDTQYTERLQKIEAILDRTLPQTPDEAWVRMTFGDLPSIPGTPLVQELTAPGRDLIDRGGKRWRPLLMTLTCETLGGGDSALDLVPLVEYPHNGSLIHDDIEDSSDERRGKPAIHILYGLDRGLNSGSFLYFVGLTALQNWAAPAARKNAVTQCWGLHLRRIHLGQAMDIAWHRNFSSLPSLEEYDLMCRMKTGVLARMAIELGVYTAGLKQDIRKGIHIDDPLAEAQPELARRLADEGRLAEALGLAAENLGVGFQIFDDVKNLTTGNPGKKRGDDIVEGKKSLPVILFLQQNPSRIEFVKRCFSAARAQGTGAREVEELIGELDQAGVIAEARQRGMELIERAMQILETEAFMNYPLHEEAHKLLVNFVSLLG